MKSKNKPIWRGLYPHSSTVTAYCPKCDKAIRHYKQKKCEFCKIEFEWKDDK